MHTNANLEPASCIKRRFYQFRRTASTMDLRTTEHDRKLAQRKRQAERYEQRHGTGGKRSVFAVDDGPSGTARQQHAADRRAFP